MRIEAGDFYKKCNEEEEMFVHQFCFCQALLSNRCGKPLGQEILEQLEEAMEQNVNDLEHFISGWKCPKKT